MIRMFWALTGPLLWNHAQALGLVLPLKGIEIQDTAERRKKNLLQMDVVSCQRYFSDWTADLQVCISAWTLKKKPTSFLSFRYSSIF